jgi:uncharacterized protein
MHAVLDTNIIVSSALAPHGISAHILSLLQEDMFRLVVSEAILAEYQGSLSRREVQKRHQLTISEMRALIDDFRETAIVVEPEIHLDVVKNDPDDNKFIECAVAGRAEVIVTNDADLLAVESYQGVEILRPHAFLELLTGRQAA